MSTLVELVRQNLGEVGERRVWDEDQLRDAAENFWRDEIVYEEAAEWPGAGTFTGRDAVLARFEEYRELLGHAESVVEEIVEIDPDRVLVVWRYHSVATASGVPIDQQWAYLLTARDDKLARWQALIDAETARRELGAD